MMETMPKFVEIITTTPFFGIVLTLSTFALAQFLYKKKPIILFNPFLVSFTLTVSVVLIFMKCFKMPLSNYSLGGDIVQFFLGPATVCLALPLFRQIHLLKENWLPILVGATVGTITSLLSILIIGKAIGLSPELIRSFAPKSITTPLGIELSGMLNGITPLTVMSISIAGITGNLFAPAILKLFRIKNPVSVGISMGVSSHVFGTNRALQIGDQEGALSALSLVITGILTLFLAPLFVTLFLG